MVSIHVLLNTRFTTVSATRGVFGQSARSRIQRRISLRSPRNCRRFAYWHGDPDQPDPDTGCFDNRGWHSINSIPCTVVDPFAGSGTTGKVALELGRSAILIELNPKYAELIDKRCAITPGL